MTFLLDTLIVSFFVEAGRERELAHAASLCPMAIAEDVRRELENDPDRGGKSFQKWFTGANIRELSILVGSPEALTLAQLRSAAAPDKGLGERASIALAASDASLTFVTHDKGALWIAVRELWTAGERVLGVAPFLRRLFELGALTDPAIADEVVSLAGVPAQRPTCEVPVTGWLMAMLVGLVAFGRRRRQPAP